MEETDYDALLCLDSDVYVQSDLDAVWEETKQAMLFYDFTHGLNNESYLRFLEEIHRYRGDNRILTQYGGEFMAGSRADLKRWIDAAQEIFQDMIQRGFHTENGDEFITTLTMEMPNLPRVRNAGAYVYRFSTGAFRRVCSRYRVDPVVVLHVPAEKNAGMIRL